MQTAPSTKNPFWEDLAGSGSLFTAVLLSLIAVFVCCQQNLDSPNITQIGQAFGLTGIEIDARIGGEAFMWQMVVASLALVVFGYLADLTNRKVLVLVAVVVAGGAYLAASMAQTVNQFICLRALGGIGIGGIIPVMFSVIGDIFTSRSRAAASGVFMALANIGYGVGFALGGTVGAENAYGWRASFVLQGIILLGLGLLFLIGGRLPARGAADMRSAQSVSGEYQGRIHLADLRRILSNRTNLVFITTTVIATAPSGYYQRFLADYFANDIGLGAGGGTLILLLVLSGALLGDAIGGLGGDILQRRDRRGPPYFACATLLGAAALFYAFFAYPYGSHPGLVTLIAPVILGFLAAALMEVQTPVSKAIMLNVNIPENRGTISALIQVTAQIGFGLGALIGAFGPRVSALLGLVSTRLFNFKLATLILVPVALTWLIVVYTYPRDEERTVALLRTKLGGPPT